MTDKDFRWIEERISEIMIEDGPDGHSDGSEIITNFVISLLKGKEDDWWESYERKVVQKHKERKEWNKKHGFLH